MFDRSFSFETQMDNVIVLSDEEKGEIYDQHQQLPSCSSQLNIDNDRLVAIQLELTDINEEISRLRHRRFKLLKQQQKLQETLNQQSIQTKSTKNSNDQWSKTGFYSIN